jgi:hypothetical protein
MRDDKTADGSACYRCEKCLNTLVYLELLGIREKFSNFPQPLTLLRFLHFRWINFSNAYYLSFLPRYLVRERRFDLLTIFWVMFLPVELKLWLKHRLIALMPKRWVYALKKRVFGDPTAR